jgi:ABC-type glycerol-3-phosphate transport system substrate-binding protein
MTTIRVLVADIDPVFDIIVADYMDKYPNDRVEVSTLAEADDWLATVKARIEQGDVDVVPVFDAEAMVGQKLVQSLAPHITATRYDLEPYGSGLDQLRRNGVLYELPFRVDPFVLAYNRDQFQAAGVPEPSHNWTWDQFREAASRLTHNEGSTRVWGFASERITPVVITLGNQTKNALGVPSPAAVGPVLRLLSTMVFQDRSMPQVSTGVRSGGSLFGDGEAAMAVETLAFFRWMGPSLPFRYDFAPFPVAPGAEPVLVVSPVTYGIAATSRNPGAAWRFLTYLTGAEGAAVAVKSGILPGYQTEAIRRAWFDRNPRPTPGTELFFTTPRSYPFFFGNDTSGDAYRLLKQATEQALSGQKSYEQAAADYAKGYEEIMAGSH